MLYLKLNSNYELKFSKEEISKNELVDFDELIELVCEGTAVENGMYFVKEGVCFVSGECGENIYLIKI